MRASVPMVMAVVVLGVAPGLSGLALAADDEMSARRDALLAERMKEWMDRSGGEPSARDLERDSSLRRMWEAYQRDKRRNREDDGDRRKAYLEWLASKREERARKDYQRARDSFASKRYPEAIDRLKDILMDDRYANYHEDAKATLDEIEQLGMADVSAAKLLAAEGKYEEAFQKYRTVMFQFRGAPCASAAAQASVDLKKDPRYLAQRAKELAENRLKRAETAMAEKDYATAASLYEAAAKVAADLPEGQTARAKLEALKADPAIWKIVEKQRSEQEARSLIAAARSYITMGMRDKAEPRLKEVIEKHRDTESAKEAKAILDGTDPGLIAQPEPK